MPPDSAYVGLGSNLGNRAGNLLLAVRGMMNAGLRVARLSSVYETAPVDVLEQPMFLNMVVEVEGMSMSSEQLMGRLLKIEYALGRRRDVPRGARTIDLDLLTFGDATCATDFLTRRRRVFHRAFRMTPLAELAPDKLQPTLAEYSDLIAATSDNSDVAVATNGAKTRKGQGVKG